jgi:hypothetical protein
MHAIISANGVTVRTTVIITAMMPTTVARIPAPSQP